MEVTNAEFEKSLPCVEVNPLDQQTDWSSDFEIDFKNDNNEQFRLKGTVSCDIFDETDKSGEDDRTWFGLQNFTFNHLNQIVNDEFIKPTFEEVNLMKIEIENYLNKNFE